MSPSPEFTQAAAYLSGSTSVAPSTQTKLELYGLFKCVTTSILGPNVSKPSIFDMTGRAKWDAWANAGKSCEGSQETAERKYLEIATQLGWSPTQAQLGSSSTTTAEASSSMAGSAQSKEGADTEDDEDDIWDKEPPRKGQGGGFAVSVSSVAPPTVDPGDGEGVHAFALSGDILGLRCILDSGGVDINAPDEYGFTPLHLAADRGNLDVVKLLLEHHADPSIKDEDGFTPYHLAEEAGREEIAQVLANAAKMT